MTTKICNKILANLQLGQITVTRDLINFLILSNLNIKTDAHTVCALKTPDKHYTNQ